MKQEESRLSINAKSIRETLILRRAAITLSLYIEKHEIKVDPNGINLRGFVKTSSGSSYPLTIKVDRLLRPVTDELLRLEPAVIGGRIPVDDVRMILIGLYSPLSVVYDLRTRIRAVTGLVRNERIRRFLVWRRIKASERAKSGALVKRRGRSATS